MNDLAVSRPRLCDLGFHYGTLYVIWDMANMPVYFFLDPTAPSNDMVCQSQGVSLMLHDAW